jgi:uncharacterized SAM-binding protein YcdF (DUF218 family)
MLPNGSSQQFKPALPISRRLLWPLLLIAVWLSVAPLLARFLIVRTGTQGADAIIVLSGSSAYEERLKHAIVGYQQGRAPLVVLTNDGLKGRWSRRRQSNLYSYEHGRDALLEGGVHENRIVLLEQRVSSTYDEAFALREYARSNGLRSVLIVTSPYHSRRALWVFRRVVGAKGVVVEIDPVAPGYQSPNPAWWWLTGRGWQHVGAEYVKLLYYLVRHR